MSHITHIATKFTDLDAIRAAVEAFGLTLEGAGDVRFYRGQTSPADAIVRFDDQYDVGFKQGADGSYAYVCDSETPLALMYNGKPSAARTAWGVGFNGFAEEYTAQVVTSMYESRGYQVTREALVEGGVKLTVGSY